MSPRTPDFTITTCRCGSDRISAASGRRTVHYLDRQGHRRSLRVTVKFDRCEACGEAWHLPKHLAATHEVVVEAMGFVPPSALLGRRRAVGLTQREVADRARIGQRRLSALERGLSFPTAQEDGRIRAALGLRGRVRGSRVV
jgi:hypothetical protein